MLNIASFLTPLAVRPDPNGAAANLVNAEHNWANEKQNKEQLSEQTRHSKAEEGIWQVHLDLAKQEHADALKEHKRDLHIKMLDWATGVLDKEGYEKGSAIVGPVLKAAGIGWEQPAPGTPDQGPQPQAGPAPSASTPSPSGNAGVDQANSAAAAIRGTTVPYPGQAQGNAGIDQANSDAEAIRSTEVPYPGQKTPGKKGGFNDSRNPLAGQSAKSSVRTDRGNARDEMTLDEARAMGLVGAGPSGALGDEVTPRRTTGAFGSGSPVGATGDEVPSDFFAGSSPKPGQSVTEFVGKKAESAKDIKKEVTAGPEATDKAEAVAFNSNSIPPIRIYDADTGETYGYLDVGKIEGVNRSRAKERAEAYAKGEAGTNPVDVTKGFLAGARSEADVETRMGRAEEELNRQNKTANVMANHPKGGGGGGLNPKLTGALTDDQEQHIQRALTNAGVPKLNQAANDGEKVSMLAESKDPLQDKVAAGQMLKSLFGAAASEGERAFVFGSEGEFVRLQQMANNWLNGGEMPPQFAAAIRAASRRMGELARKKAHDVTERTISDVENDPIIGFHRMGLKTPEEFEARKKTLRDLGTAGEGSNPNDEASKLGF